MIPSRRKWGEGSGTYLGTRTTYSVTFWLLGPCGWRSKDSELGVAEAAAGTPELRRILTRAAMGDDRWFGPGPRPSVPGKPPSPCRVSGPDRGPQARGATDPGSSSPEAVLSRPALSGTTPATSAPAPNLEAKHGLRCDGNLLRLKYPRLFPEGRAQTAPELENTPSAARAGSHLSIQRREFNQHCGHASLDVIPGTAGHPGRGGRS